jgi:serine/threonine protein kinase
MEQIGEGGMGVVYVAEQHQPVRRKVALKIIKPGMDSKPVVARFEAERQALAMMDHSNIARVFDGGTTPSGRPYFVMELVRGIPITEYCDREKLSIPERLELFVLVCRAVQHAHQKGIIHRDLKPSNILVTVIDGAAVPKVIDFGVAKATGGSLTERTIYTAFQQFVGTPLYMSPEQADLAGVDVDTRSDIYSLGVLLYELLTGTTPFDQEIFRTAALDEMRRILREQEPPRPSTRLSALGAAATTVSANRKADARQLDRTIRGELDWVVMKALEKDRRRRYETAGEFAADIMRYLTDQPVQACPPSAWYRFSKLARRNRATLVTSTVVAASLVLGTAMSTWEAIRATGAERAADTARENESSARKRAEEAEKTARAEAEKAKAINEFLVNDLLVRAEPGKNHDLSMPGQEAAASRLTLREALDRAAEKVGKRFRELPLVEAALRTTMSDTYDGLAAWTECRKQAAAALAIYEREKGPGAAETLNAVRRLGHALNHEGKSIEAEQMLRRSLDGLSHVLGEGPDTLQAMHDLGWLYTEQGKFAQAEPLLAQALEVGRRVLGEGHPDTLDDMIDLARMYRWQGRWARGEPLLVQALEVARRALGEEHNVTVKAMFFLSRYYQADGQYPKAEQLKLKELEIRRRTLGKEDDQTLTTLDGLAGLYLSMGKLSQAEPLFLEYLEAQRRLHGEENLGIANGYNCLACLYKDQGKLSEAESLFMRALEIGRRRPWGERLDTLYFVSNLARLYKAQQRLAQAVPLFLREFEERCSALGEKHPDTLQAMTNLAGLYVDLGEFTKAEPLLIRALEVRRKAFGEDQPETIELTQLLAQKYLENGYSERSIPLFERAWTWDRKQPDPLAGDLASIPFELGMAYEQTGQLEKAEPLYREALEMLRQRHREGSEVSEMFQSSLARNLLKQQKSEGYAEAEALSRECLKFRERNQADDYATFHTKSLLGASLLGQKKYAEAEPLLLAGYEGMRQREGKIPAVRKFRMTDAIEWLVQFYEATGKTGKADEWRKKLTAARSVETKKR